MSASVTWHACLATLPISVFSGSASPALSNAARRWARDASPSPSRIRATNALRAAVMFDKLVLLSIRSRASEQLEQTAPVTFGVEDASHFITAGPVAVEAAMFQLDACSILTVGDEANLDFGLQARVGLPVGADVPGKHQARVRLPREDSTPLTRASIVTAFVPAAPDTRLDHRIHRLGFADLVVRQRPPCAHLLRKHPPRHRRRRLDGNGLPHGVRIHTGGDRLLFSCYRHRSLSFHARSAASLNATSASSQNSSSQRRTASIPLGSSV